jgi:hypothetical protein
VFFSQKYGADFGHATINPTVPVDGDCPIDQQHYDDIWTAFVDLVTTGEIKTLLSNAQALAFQFQVVADATGTQTAFAATESFSMEIEGEFLVTTGLTVAGPASNATVPVTPDSGSWDEATAAAAIAIAGANQDVQFHPITLLSGATFTANVDNLRAHLAGFAGLRVDPVFTAWGQSGSRLFSRVTMGEKSMVVDTHLGLAHGPYSVEPLERPFVGDALAPYMSNYMSEHVAVMAGLTPCNGDNPAWNLPTVPKPVFWPPAMPGWPTLPAAAAPGTIEWRCETVGTAGCRCQATRSAPCNCNRLAWFCDSCQERVECIWHPGTTPGAPASCPADKPNPPPTQMPAPPAGNSFRDIYWRVDPW